jgi:multicomponent Na+:H+ antiporter subunit F
LAEHILTAAAVLIFCGVGLGVFRLILGPTVIDRIAAIDMLTIVCISIISLSRWSQTASSISMLPSCMAC